MKPHCTMKFEIYNITNDSSQVGIGLFVIVNESIPSEKSLVGFFYSKENKSFDLEIFWVRFTIKIS